MANNKIEKIKEVRLLDGVLQQANINGKWYALVNAPETRSGSFTLELSDTGKVLMVSSASTATITIPNLNFLNGTTISLVQWGAGGLTVSAGTGVTVRGELSTDTQYTVIQVLKVNSTEWLVIGGTTV